MNAPQCRVRGCDKHPDTLFTLNTGIALQKPVCAFHAQALESGEHYDVDDDTGDLLTGENAPLEIINAEVHSNAAGSTVTFIVGRDGVEYRRMTVRVEAALLRDVADWI